MIHNDPSTWTELVFLSAPAAGSAFSLDHDSLTLSGDTDGPPRCPRSTTPDGALLNSSHRLTLHRSGITSDGGLVSHCSSHTNAHVDGSDLGTVVRNDSVAGNQYHGLRSSADRCCVVDADTYPDDPFTGSIPVDGGVLEGLPVDPTFGLIREVAHDGTRFSMQPILTRRRSMSWARGSVAVL